jgi:hypothetical protein
MASPRTFARPNRGARLKELINAGVRDEDEDINDEWKETAVETDYVSTEATSVSSTDEDFSDTETSGKLSDASGRSSVSERQKKKCQPTVVKAIRMRQDSKLSQQDRMAKAKAYSLVNSEILETIEARFLQTHSVGKRSAARGTLLFYSGEKCLQFDASHFTAK